LPVGVRAKRFLGRSYSVPLMPYRSVCKPKSALLSRAKSFSQRRIYCQFLPSLLQQDVQNIRGHC